MGNKSHYFNKEVTMWIYRPIDRLIKEDFEKNNWYCTAKSKEDCKEKIAALIKAGKYKKGELMYDYFRW